MGYDIFVVICRNYLKASAYYGAIINLLVALLALRLLWQHSAPVKADTGRKIPFNFLTAIIGIVLTAALCMDRIVKGKINFLIVRSFWCFFDPRSVRGLSPISFELILYFMPLFLYAIADFLILLHW